MTLDEFKSSFNGNEPPVCLSIELKAMWYAANDIWDAAHELIQHKPGSKCALIHAYLHRLEGDKRNADYWYSRAGKKRSILALNDEYHEILESLF